MKINKRQEIAMWIFGFIWCAVFAADFWFHGNEDFDLYAILAIPTFLVLFSLRSRN